MTMTDDFSLSLYLSNLLAAAVEFMGNDCKSPQHMSVHPMYVSIPTMNGTSGSASSTQISSKKDPNNQFGVVVTSINRSNTNSLSSTYVKNVHDHQTNIHNNTNNHSPHQLHLQQHFNHIRSPTHQQLISADHHRQMSSLSNLSNTRCDNNLISKSASTQQIIKRHPTSGLGSGNRSDIRYTEIIASADDYLAKLSGDDGSGKDVDTSSTRSYFMPSSTQSTAVASPISTNKLMATNLQQQQLISKHFGIQQNPLNNLIHEGFVVEGKSPADASIGNNRQAFVQKPLPAIPTDYNHHQQQQQSKYLPASNQQQQQQRHHHQIMSPQEVIQSQKQFQFGAPRSPNLNQMPRRRTSNHQQHQAPQHHQLEMSHSSCKLPANANFADQIRGGSEKQQHYNINQFIPEYRYANNPLPAIPPHMLQHPVYRVRSQDRISQRLRRQSGANPHDASGENQRPRSFCNNMINYQDYKD